MHNSAMFGCIGESLSIKLSYIHSLCRYLFFMLVSAEKSLLQRQVVAKGIKVFTARFAKAGYSARRAIQKSVSDFCVKSIFKEPLVAISMRPSCSEMSRCAVGLLENGW